MKTCAIWFPRPLSTGFYGKPRVDLALLEQYHEGLIALSACLAGAIPQHLMGEELRGGQGVMPLSCPGFSARETSFWSFRITALTSSVP